MSATEILLRSLLGGGLNQPVEGDYVNLHADEAGSSGTQDLRIAAVFVILAAGLLGGLPPLFFALFKDQGNPLTRILRAFSGGIILALALVHIIPEGLVMMDALTEYSYGGPTVVFGVIFMVLMENASQMFLTRSQGRGHACHHTHSRGSGETQESGKDQKSAAVEGGGFNSIHAHAHAHDVESQKAACMPEASVKPTASKSLDEVAIALDQDHTHTCLRTNSVASWLASAEPKPTGTIKQQVAAYMFELGCVTHSFIIGLSLGTTVTGRSQVIALLIAIAFHQALEGMSLGSVVVTAGFSRMKSLIMIFSYGVTTPAGVAVGIAVAASYNPESTVALAVQGTLDCIAGGMLLYISLIQLIAEDFSREDHSRPVSVLVRLSSYLALVLGCFCMCLLANWA